MTQPAMPYLMQQPTAPTPYQARSSTRNKKLVGTLVLLVTAGLLAALVTVWAFGNGPVAFLVGVLPCVAMLAAAIICLLWLDRWEPEPWQLLALGFVWGGGFATAFALGVQIVLELFGFVADPFAAAVVQAPLLEEIGKGSFLFLMAFTLRRRELSSLVDFLIYAGFVGLGFAFVEDLLYFARSEDISMTALMVVMRLWGGIFAHPLFTSMTALGLFLGRKKRGPWTVLGPALGLLGAMVLHGIWNFSASTGLFLFVYALFMVPVFVVMALLAVRSRAAEGATVARQLPAMVRQGIVAGVEAQWLGNLTGRAARARQAAVVGGKQAGTAVLAFTDAVTELAFLRDRLDKGEATPKLLAEHQDLVNHVEAERQAALPILRQIWNAPLAPDSLTPAPPPAPAAQQPFEQRGREMPTGGPAPMGTMPVPPPQQQPPAPGQPPLQH